MKTPNWADIEAFCQVDGWQKVSLGRSADHHYYQLVLEDGTALETRASHAAGKKMSPGRWKAILRDQLKVSDEAFWTALRSKQPVLRPGHPPEESEIEQVPLWAAQALISRLKMTPQEVVGLGRARAIQMAQELWSTPSG